MDLKIGKGAKVAALALATYVLSLPSSLDLCLENYYYIPALTKNNIYVSCLKKMIII